MIVTKMTDTKIKDKQFYGDLSAFLFTVQENK